MSIMQVHIPILDEIRKKGLKPALLAKVDDVAVRLTTGLNVKEIRAVLRGDPPPRPNPRLQPHADGFWLHMKPSFYHNLRTGLYPDFRLGWLSIYFFLFETLTGVFLMIFYTPSPLVAYENMLNILGNVPFGRLMRDLHKLGAELMVIVVSLHMLRTFITGDYKKPRQFTWFTGVILLLVTLILSFSGYLLPWDQLSLWAVTIGASMVEAIPPQAVGDTVNLIARGGPQFNAGGLLRWYLLHVLFLPLLGINFLGVHYYKVVLHGHSLPPEAQTVGEDTAKRVPIDQRLYFLPDIVTRELFLASVLTLILIAWSIFAFHAPLELHADPLITPLHTTAPWYFLWIQGMLKIGDKFLWGLVVPGMMFGVLFVLPYVEVGPSRRYADRRVGLTMGFLTLIVLAVLSYMGTPRYAVTSSPDQEVVAELLPQTHPGPLREANWDELTPGKYAASDWERAGELNLTPTLERLLRLYHEEMEKATNCQRRPDDCLRDGEAFMTIENWQTDLKKITFRVIWEGGPAEVCVPGQEFEFCQTAYLHRLSHHGQGE